MARREPGVGPLSPSPPPIGSLLTRNRSHYQLVRYGTRGTMVRNWRTAEWGSVSGATLRSSPHTHTHDGGSLSLTDGADSQVTSKERQKLTIINEGGGQ
ncbi:hypothetical protein RRG08_065470 [Elysia crispata]|uniref:Uncharacterized protein n=1 Tax=Elysia crispata TaxID=231223 RepID=A0AAE1AQ73_9GAST|nr:hypothetical protein RRG08_065470 [Elysia crispata]